MLTVMVLLFPRLSSLFDFLIFIFYVCYLISLYLSLINRDFFSALICPCVRERPEIRSFDRVLKIKV